MDTMHFKTNNTARASRMEGFLKLCFSTYQTIFTEKLYLCLICSFRMYINMNLKLSFIYCALIIMVRYKKKMFTHADSDILQDLYILSTFLNSVYANCLWYSFKIHSSFDDKHVNVYKVVHVLAFF